MDAILFYIKKMIPFMLICLILYIPFRFGTKKKGNKTSVAYEILMAIFFVYMSGLLSLTVFPREGLSGGNGGFNLVPFRTIFPLFKASVMSFLILFVGNVVMFMPIGFFIPLLWNKRIVFTCVTGALFSLLIELSQILIGRNTDIDDLILNTLGVFLGYLVFLLLEKYCSAVPLKKNNTGNS